jgi:hypothetical protein
MTHVLMIRVMRAISTMRIVAADADDTMTVLHVIMTVVVATVILTGAHVITTEEGMDVNLGIMIAAMTISGIELQSKKDLPTGGRSST